MRKGRATFNDPILNTWYDGERHLRKDRFGRELFRNLLANINRRRKETR